ncbi:SDR family NAD(P)-dependent oxidoreductase [Conyzicola sp.]|uniref:SDR family NAD(P)-dependent oxidoreductase n=1 Tax=Conyzicola sp. TaxID=1969404 RepID=UPI0039898CD1
MSKDQNLTGKTIVVAGASSGFGRGAAQKLAELGANVVVAARRSDALDEFVAQIAARGGTAVAVPTDVSDAADVARLAATAIERFGRIDVWVNNVGIGALGLFWDIPVEDHARVVDVNLTGLIYGAHAALTHFLSVGDGVLVNVGSVDSEVPLAYQASYAASKAAVLSLSRTLNEELRLVGKHDTIKVGTIMPWAVDTPWWSHAANYTGHAPRMAAMDDPSIVVDAIVAACTNPKEEQPVGPKARASDVSHHLFPDLTERLSAKVADAEVDRGSLVAHTTGSIHEPTPEGTTVDGGIRERMKREDAAR